MIMFEQRINTCRMILIAPQLLFLYVLLLIPALSSAADTLDANRFLTRDQTLVSRNGIFEMGFFKPGNSPSYYIGIWYKYYASQTVIWVANRETPIPDSFTYKLKIINGNLVLLNESNSHIWSTNMSSTDTPASVTLLDNGNMVLRYGSSSSPPIWQSFDHPSHTFLPGQKLGYNKVTNTKQVLTSWKSRDDPRMGLFSLELDQNKKQYVLKWNRSVEYWANNGSWNAELYNFSYIDNINESYFTYYSDYSLQFAALSIETSGQITMQSWWETYLNVWGTNYSEQPEFRKVYGACGPFGVYDDRWPSGPHCKCMTGFEPRSEYDWDMGSFFGGCVRKIEVNCSVMIEKPVFILSYLNKSFVSAFPRNEAMQLNESTCRQSCLDNCVCNAYTFISNVCQHWDDKNMNSLSLGFVTNHTYPDTFHFYIKVASEDLPRLVKNSRKKNKDVNWGVVVGLVAGVVLLLGFILVIVRRKKRTSVGKTTMEGSLVAFAYRDLRIATKSFSNKLGGGSFGCVFKGILHDSTVVAVKKLESVSQGEKQFRSEVGTIGIIQHVNLVRLFGFCAQGKCRLLVYDYMPNGSLNSHLFHENQCTYLNWQTRYQIALGTARGLVYLHEKCRDRIIHCDIKPENILLDDNFTPKIADFGMAKLIGRDFSRVLKTMRGTRGYLAPEWLSGVAVTAKADVFSYGMMLFELISGKRNSHQSKDGSLIFFPGLAANVLMAGGDILSLLDCRLNRIANVEEVTKIFKVAYWCIQHEEDIRPSMSEVERILEGVSDVSMPPIPQYVKFFDNEIMEDFLFFKPSSSTETQKPEAKLLESIYSESSFYASSSWK